jgi:hypothetical protein
MVFHHGRHEQRQADVSGAKKRSVHIVDTNDRAAMHKLSATNSGLRYKKIVKLRPQLHLEPFGIAELSINPRQDSGRHRRSGCCLVERQSADARCE